MSVKGETGKGETGGLQEPASFNLEVARKIAANTRALVIGPYQAGSGKKAGAYAPRRELDDRFAEAVSLARALNLAIIATMRINLHDIRPASYLGTGKMAELAALIEAEEITLVIMDCALSPVQQRNLEKALNAKVIDRTGLILEIFGQRARTREGVLQVELAHLAYQKSRLVRSWTHLERQRGGFGFLGGPGETQIETDRRLIQDRMSRIERDLEAVKRTRALHRAARREVPYPVVALVGYTNAGKSTLFNRLTAADVVAADQLFATLDPTMRQMRLPHGGRVILSDTVGFISELPTGLISAFRATLEEVLNADIILHVRDIASPDSAMQEADVEAVLAELGLTRAEGPLRLEVLNKIDLLTPERREALLQTGGPDGPIAVSALDGQGCPQLLERIEAMLAADYALCHLELKPDDGANLTWLYRNGEVLARSNDDDGMVRLEVRMSKEAEARFNARMAQG